LKNIILRSGGADAAVPNFQLFLLRLSYSARISRLSIAGQKVSHNVLAVYDVFASPIKETVGFQGLQKCGWSGAWEAQPT
jgi:hypothetical protein